MKTKKLIGITIVLAGMLSGCDSDDAPDLTIDENAAPNTMDVMLTTQTDIPISDRLQATDDDGDALTFSIDIAPAIGAVELMENGEFTYTPPFEKNGMDSFTFTVSDGNNGLARGTVMIDIEELALDIALYTRDAFVQDTGAPPLSVNGRVFIDNGDDDFADLLVD